MFTLGGFSGEMIGRDDAFECILLGASGNLFVLSANSRVCNLF